MMKKFLSVVLATAMLSGSIMTYADDIHDTDSADGIIEFFDDGNMIDNAEAERLYIEKLFSIDEHHPSLYANHGSELLTGAAKDIYEQLKPLIKEIADGKRTRTDNLFVPCSGATYDDVSRAVDFVIADATENFYWFGNGLLFRRSSQGVSIDFSVSSEYAASGRDYEVNPAIMNKAREAVTSAKSIAAKYDGMMDHEKIYGYANEICRLTDYGLGGLNPHQLVNVFDGDDSTEVVCEGYARAFQYLCDLGGIECYNVTSSDHRWNIVVLDGVSYHVDCTWADGYSIEAVEKYHPYILRGVAKSDGKGVEFDFTVPGYLPSTGSLSYDEDTLAMYPQSILKVSIEDYVPPRFDAIKINITTDGGAPDISELKVTVKGNGTDKSIGITGNTFDVSALADGSYTFTFSANNCAPRAYDIKVTGGSANGISTVTLHLYGDIDGNGKVNTLDVAKANAHAKNKILLSGYNLVVGDIDGNGKVNTLDVAKINAHAKNRIKIW